MNKAVVTALPGQPTMLIERTFAATPERLFAALTQKSQLERWWIGPGYQCRVDHIDPRDGGSWKFVLSDSPGQTYTFHGSFHEVSPRRIVQTVEVDVPGEKGHVGLEKRELIPLGTNQTKLRVMSTFLSVGDRDRVIQNGMEEGMTQTYARLDEVLKEEGEENGIA